MWMGPRSKPLKIRYVFVLWCHGHTTVPGLAQLLLIICEQSYVSTSVGAMRLQIKRRSCFLQPSSFSFCSGKRRTSCVQLVDKP